MHIGNNYKLGQAYVGEQAAFVFLGLDCITNNHYYIIEAIREIVFLSKKMKFWALVETQLDCH